MERHPHHYQGTVFPPAVQKKRKSSPQEQNEHDSLKGYSRAAMGPNSSYVHLYYIISIACHSNLHYLY